ncbi:MAG TPA: hypothetical protein VMV13_11785 [Candidatus Binataceae bacterium]|nr:hypothetical protein [Candidatus Binataceae bacterium]
MRCWKCSTEIASVERIGFRDRCPRCDSALHVCRNCDLYDPALSNQCRETIVERVADKERTNFCEYFTVRLAAKNSAAANAGATVSAGAARPEPNGQNARDGLEALFKKRG